MSHSEQLSNSVNIRLEYTDESVFGAVISGQSTQRLKRYFEPLLAHARARGVQSLVEQTPELLGQLLGSHTPSALYTGSSLREDLLYPQIGKVAPSHLRVDRPHTSSHTIPIASALVPELASWLGDWQRGESVPHAGPALALYQALQGAQAFEPHAAAQPLTAPVSFVGHATVLLTTRRARLLVDPFLLPQEPQFPAGYQPCSMAELNPDIVLITHSHPDHFHLDTLLRLGKDTLLVVPEVPRESCLSVDVAARLKQLGFTRVQSLAWFEELVFQDFRVVALPFYGEQPTTEQVLHPELRNCGNSYLVEAEGRRYSFIADAGRDRAGSVQAVASYAVEKYGPVDVLFGGYRSWSLFPAQYALTSVPQYLLLVPPALWRTRQTIMNDAAALLDTAERWHARYVVPYADGGAPWYWQLELGPRLDTLSRDVNPHFDPRPEVVQREAANRSSAGHVGVASPVQVLLARPGDSLDFDAQGRSQWLSNAGHVWPYVDHEASQTAAGAVREPVGLTRKRVLLRLLAREELLRRGVEILPNQVQAMSDELRRDNRLSERSAMLDWLTRTGLSMAEYSEILRDWQGVIHLENVLAPEIEKHISAQRAFASMRNQAER